MDWGCVDYLWIIMMFFMSCLDCHSDGTHSLQRIHWWASDVILHFYKYILDGLRVSTFFIFGSTIPLRVKNKPYLRCCTLVQVDKGASGDRSNGRRGGTADSRGGCQGDGTGPVWHSDYCRRPRRCWSRVIHAHQPIINQTNPSLCVW